MDKKLDAFITKGYSMQMKKLYDFRCTLSSKDHVIDLTSRRIYNELGNHILICGGHFEGLELLVEEMRKISDVPICIISMEEKHMDEFGKLTSRFVNVFFFKGHCLSKPTLKNANLAQA